MPERKKSDNGTRRELMSERDRLKAILDSMDDGIYIVGRDYRIGFMNLALRNEMGDGENQLCHEFFGHSRSSCDECLHGMSSFGPRIRREWFVAKTRKTYDVVVSPIHEPDGRISRLHILRDITERKRLEAELQEYSQRLEAKVAEQSEKLLRQERLALLGEISAGLAHEIRTPLGAIMTGVKLLEKGASSPEEQNLVFELLKRETHRLERKLSEFLTYAKPRMPRILETHIPSLFQELRTILSTDRKLLGNVEIRISTQPDIPPWPLDPDLIKEALLNICVNGLQALRGTGVLSLGARTSAGMLEIHIRDNGPGIPPEVLPHIFKPFYSKRSEGTGLGLAIAKEIVESQGGRITASSIPSLNTTFRIVLPHSRR